jgi:hypothetical protein
MGERDASLDVAAGIDPTADDRSIPHRIEDHNLEDIDLDHRNHEHDHDHHHVHDHHRTLIRRSSRYLDSDRRLGTETGDLDR